jgi:hypothetical protein
LPDLHYCNLNKKFKNYVLNLVNFSKFERIPSWIWLLFFGAWFQLFGLFTHCHVAGTVNKILNRNEFGEGNHANQGRRVFLFINFLGAFHSKRSSYASQYIQIYLFS